ncbi:hat family dimerization [Fusarium beomiforme]|uniref:Hat family dimerization n=1 Tax=Fusarium beomiforme TaxID=44412 RepID=A0A9P5AAA5_9HYPO|nr:hat family dimerization [Fusarium beomiforme]
MDAVFRTIFEMPDEESLAGTSPCFETTQSEAGDSALLNLRRTRSIANQLATIRPEHLDVAQPSSPRSLYIDGLRYVLEDWIHKKRRRSWSWIPQYGKYVIKLSDDDTAGARYWICGLCDARNQVKILEAKATTSPIYHLNNDHNIYKASTAHDNGPDSEPELPNRTSPAPSSSVSVLDMQNVIAGRSQFRLIGLEKLSGSHGGENPAILMAKIIQKYGPEKKIGFFTADNADPYDTCIQALFKMFNPRASPTELESLEGEWRIRCVGHILNLLAMAILGGRF